MDNTMSSTGNSISRLDKSRRQLGMSSRCIKTYSMTALLMVQSIGIITCQSFRQNAELNPSRSSPPVNLEPLQPIFALQAMAEGPGVDLVALNRRRFELEHHHGGSSGEILDQELKRGQSIEDDLSALSSKLMATLPGDLTKQLFETANVDSSLITGITSGHPLLQSSDESTSSMDDPDGASIARLTKSCLTVHASSARPEQLDVKFYLFTKSNPKKAHVLTPQVSRLELLRGSPFDPNKPIKWITHGFHTNVDKSEWMNEAKDKILQYEDANVILTDWRRGASPALAFYPKAAANAHVVAKFIVRILRRLKDDIDLSQVHLIGHSLGAHIMGFVGSAFTEEHLMRQQHLLKLASSRQRTGPAMFWRTQEQPKKLLIGRITACDPALPCFGPSSSGPVRQNNQPGPAATYRDSERQSRQQKMSPVAVQDAANSRESSITIEGGDWTPSMWTHLRPDSAIIVEVMHSNPGVMGYADPLGDFDFYPNGFERQPGCGNQQQQQQQQQELTPPVPVPVYSAGPISESSSNIAYSKTKRSWSSVMDGFMSKVVRPLLASETTNIQQPTNLATNQPSQASVNSQKQHPPGGSLLRTETSRFSQTIDRFLNPIKSFFKGNTCSHHRSVEYMVESLYYDRTPPDRKLDRDSICQMVGYRCRDYASFKKGFCFRCLNSNLDCRTFGMSLSSAFSEGSVNANRLTSLRSGFQANERQLNLFEPRIKEANGSHPAIESISEKPTGSAWISTNLKAFTNETRRIMKRVLPTFDHYDQNYLPQGRNQYFFETRSNKSFCLHHYHIHIRYRWFRVRDNILLDGFRLLGTLANLNRKTPIQLHKFSHNSYTAILSEPLFLGQIESLVVFGAKVKPTLIEYIEITFMSNLDPKIRALGSAKLCRAPQHPSLDPSASLYNQVTNDQIGDQLDGLNQPLTHSVFIRCSGALVR